ncbi:FAD-binding oxidoreductase [Candidatus Saccharibacteria bacterium]|nr:FAD-binding oxidoreductase [Candidatus Saccharibacteria bacterium]
MSKITEYLNEHILGEVTSAESVRRQFARDGSVLSITPEIVAFPRVTNDIRKIARFTWQLAEKGHILPITMRGMGADTTGAAIGKGIIIDTIAHLNKIIYINLKSKDQFVHVQPGVNLAVLREVLTSHGMDLPSIPDTAAIYTAGGALANNVSGSGSGMYGTFGSWVKRLEVVLANGDLIETTRISRRELDKKKGLQTFEGEIYRKIDGIIEDNQALIDEKISDQVDNTGYASIAKVKNRDGSFDLTPLIIGSQGTLGIISEAVIRTDFYNEEQSVLVATFAEKATAIQAAALIAKENPAILDVIDGELFDMARSLGKKYPFDGAAEVNSSIGAVIYVAFYDFSGGKRHRRVKHALKKLSKFEASILKGDDHPSEQLQAIREVFSTLYMAEGKGETVPPLIDGSSVPVSRLDEFYSGLQELADKNHVKLPTLVQYMSGIVYARPTLEMHNVADKQKTFKLINEYMALIAKVGGNLNVAAGEGRLKAAAAYAQIEPELMVVYEQIRQAFDPYGTLNHGVKQSNDLKTMIAQLDHDYSLGELAKYAPHN